MINSLANVARANIVIIGPRASGKSTVGDRLALLMHREFVDLDREVLKSFSSAQTVGEVWARHGEACWRKAEAALLDEILQRTEQVVALGGGAPMIDSVQRRLAGAAQDGSAIVVYLDCPPIILQDRLREAPGDRPPLHGTDIVTEVPEVLRRRHPVYARLATFAVDSSQAPEVTAETILARLHDAAKPRN